MEKFVQREKVLIEYAKTSPKSPYRSSEDTDFNDVFGGPPRRFSVQEVGVRYSFGETVEPEEEKASSPWIVLNEKPVFGEETGTRSRRRGNDFYNDIFGGDESYSSPRKSDCDGDSLFRSSSGLRIISPARPLLPTSELFGTSLPSQFSLSSKLTKAKELPSLGSKSPLSSSTSIISSETIRGLDEIRNEIHPVFRPSPLSHETSFGSEDLPTSDQRGKTEKLKKKPKNVENDENEFHFSIYKWAGLGVPMLIPLLYRNNLKSKDINGNCIEPQEKDWRMKEEEKEQLNSTEVALDEILESKLGSKGKYTFGFDGARINLKSEKDNSLDVTDKHEETQKEFPPGIKKSLKSKLKPPHPFPDDVVKQTENVEDVKEIKRRTQKGAKSNEHGRKNVKQKEETRINSNRENGDEPSLQGETKIPGATPGKSGVRGKVREFVNIFSNETDSKLKADVKTQSQRFRWKAVGIDQKEDKVSLNEDKVIENVNLNNVEKKPDVSPKGDENIKKNEAHEYSSSKTPSHRSENFSCNQDTEFLSESPDKDSKISQDYVDESFEDMFQVEELFEDHVELSQSNEVSEDLKALDSKIQKWSFGKKGNIRSLLSTLQFVLWPESGWTPVPLMDLIEANSVKRAYQKALLRLHPDKLQQKGAETSQKYIAEKVFDILQEAWDHFNTLTPLTLS